MTPRVTLWRVCDPRHLIALTPVGAVDPASGIPQEDPWSTAKNAHPSRHYADVIDVAGAQYYAVRPDPADRYSR